MSDAPPASADAALVRAIGVRGLAAHIFNITIGGGIFALPAAVAAGLGAAGWTAHLVCAVAIGLIALCFAEAGSRVALTGGPYAYIEVALGRFAGFLAGVLLWLMGCFATAAVATVFAAAVGALAPALGGDAGRRLLLVLLFVALAVVNVLGVRQGARLVAVTAVAKLAPLLVFVALGAFAVRPENLAARLPPLSDIGATSVVLFFAYAGIESALVPSGEVRDPARTIPRALAIALLAVTALYVAIQLVAQGVLGADLAGPEVKGTPVASAAARFLGPAGFTFMLAGATVSAFGNVSGMMLSIPRSLYAFGRDGFLPAAFARVHPRFRTPHVAIAVQAAVAGGLAVSGEFEWLARLADVSILLLYLACCIAAWVLRRQGVRAAGAPFVAPGGATVPLLASLVILWLLWHGGAVNLLVVGGVLAVSAALFALTAPARRPRAQVP
jgi:basic amino acid/polyamine antiporter, APA family